MKEEWVKQINTAIMAVANELKIMNGKMLTPQVKEKNTEIINLKNEIDLGKELIKQADSEKETLASEVSKMTMELTLKMSEIAQREMEIENLKAKVIEAEAKIPKENPNNPEVI